MTSRTLYDKLWDSHVVHTEADGTALLYIDRHLVHEVTSPQAFEGLRMAGRKLRRPDLTIAVADHNVPTTDIDKPVADPISATQLKVLEANCDEVVRFHRNGGIERSRARAMRDFVHRFRDFDLQRGALADTIHRVQLKTSAGTFPMQPRPFYEDAVKHGFKREPNTDVAATLQEAVARINAQPGFRNGFSS